jgi:hypothetical protein
LIVLLLPLLVACPKTAPPTPPVQPGPDPAACDALVADNHRIAQTVREQERMLRECEARIQRIPFHESDRLADIVKTLIVPQAHIAVVVSQ